ncbi:SURF4 family-domain-containing protein [Sporodiniella umbellata]|nr:SURF4 family-domain-containing protein [Sporodiniella umbellata]
MNDFCFVENIKTMGQKVKPQLPWISRLLIVATFFEDGLRTSTQWDDQVFYLCQIRRLPRLFVYSFLGLSVMSMLVFPLCVIFKRRVILSVSVLGWMTLSQTLLYGLLLDPMVLVRNLSVTGGLLLCVSEHMLSQKSTRLFASLPQLSPVERQKYYQLAGRVLTVLLFIGFVVNGEWGVVRQAVTVIGLAACGMVIVGFQAKGSAVFLVMLLCAINFLVNDWWSISHQSYYKREFLRYDFFQCLSVTGGLLSLVCIGPGGFSYDEKRKKQF